MSIKHIKLGRSIVDEKCSHGADTVPEDPKAKTGLLSPVPETLFSHIGAVSEKNISVTINPYNDRRRYSEKSGRF